MNDQNLSIIDAEIAMARGDKVAHVYFGDGEWMTIHPELKGCFLLEDGTLCTFEEFWRDKNEKYWDTGWSIVNDLADVVKEPEDYNVSKLNSLEQDINRVFIKMAGNYDLLIEFCEQQIEKDEDEFWPRMKQTLVDKKKMALDQIK